MSKQCFVCGKKPVVGMNVSHSNRHTLRKWYPNLQNINIVVAGKKMKEYVCTKCIKAGKVRKSV
jgi:large subunit ribosomal protein L28